MIRSPNIGRSFWTSSAYFLLSAAIFGIAFTQWPLFSENQNTKYLIGLGNAGMGFLHEDWLANTIDPLPTFSALVHLTYRFLNQNFFYLYHSLLLGLYLTSLMWIADKVFGLSKTVAGQLLFGAFVVAFHSSLLPPLLARNSRNKPRLDSTGRCSQSISAKSCPAAKHFWCIADILNRAIPARRALLGCGYGSNCGNLPFHLFTECCRAYLFIRCHTLVAKQNIQEAHPGGVNRAALSPTRAVI